MNSYNEFLEHVNEEDVLGGFWPGIQLYYPPVKYSPKDSEYETMEQGGCSYS